ncbi:MAG: lytic transglycosylase domain-containing protein [Hahellaceae bacterium]|nr:lytic transglycosylase domain-containing protein [Hahellaceae bacterium]
MYRLIISVCVLLSVHLNVAARTLTLEQQRNLFQSVFKQIEKKPQLLDSYEEELQSYPLFPYLQASVYASNPARHEARIPEFIRQHAGAPFAERVRQVWLERMAKNNRAQAFMESYVDRDNDVMKCHWMRFALRDAAQQQAVLEQFQDWWTSGKTIPDECLVVELAWKNDYWPQKGHGVDDHWSRLDGAWRAKNAAVKTVTRRLIPASDKALLAAWELYDKDPEAVTNSQRWQGEAYKDWVVRSYGLDRLAWRDPERAADTFDRLQHYPGYPDRLRHRSYQTLALALATSGSARAARYLDDMPAEWVDERVTSWRVMDALRRRDYEGADRWMSLLTVEQAQEPRWRYLMGRSAELQGNVAGATTFWRPLQANYNYYGFLARAQNGALETLQPPRMVWSESTLASVREKPGMVRAAEWRRLKDDNRARREWYAVTRTLDQDGVKSAVVIADEWDWNDLVIWSLGRLRMEGAWEYRFPVLYQDTFNQEARRRSIDPSWAFAITRQESAFIRHAKSPAGAMGLMQLMPATAKMTAKRYKLYYRHQNDLLTPTVNIRLGVAHLGELINKNDGNFIYATAAYNAGQGSVNRWKRQFEGMPVDLWVESIPYRETQHYVKNVMAYSLVYARQLNRSSDVFDFLVDRLADQRVASP